ncbi:MAG: hypothetical protein J5552_05990 [Prevotella sp.]|nr:hypothetical protein [Prevotella sp.]
MEEKKYPMIDEENGLDKASEPVAESVRTNPAKGISVSGGDIDEVDWDLLLSYGPFSEEEAIARIDRFEEQLEKGQVRWTSSEEFDKQLYEEFPWLR